MDIRRFEASDLKLPGDHHIYSMEKIRKIRILRMNHVIREIKRVEFHIVVAVFQ